jgi:hypothetical protein
LGILVGGYIPRLGLAFIADISDRLARAVPSASFSFLDEFFITLPTASSSEVAVYAHAVKSWLQNLSNCLVCPREEYDNARNRAKNILRRLIELTLCQQDVRAGFFFSPRNPKSLVNVDFFFFFDNM